VEQALAALALIAAAIEALREVGFAGVSRCSWR
jgi:hypothetical protein